MLSRTITHFKNNKTGRPVSYRKTAYLLLQTTIFFLLLTFNLTTATAQSFPVQVIPQVTPPPPIYFSEYANESTVNSPLRVQLILNDFEIVNREVRLRVSFEGSGISFQSKDLVTGASPLFLEGGVPLVLTNVELAPYFRYENLNGISGNVYGNAIPEGAYNFCFEVFDVLTGSRLSQKSCAISVVFQNEPPFLVSPRNKTNVEEINPQNIVFQWTPRHVNVSNVEYELSIVEIWDTQVDPQQAFLSSPPVFQTVTNATTYVYGPADPLFLSGKNYAWRVQAKAKQGLEEVGLFENQGYSEIYSFSYAGSCDLPLGINHEVKGSTNANIFWDDFSTDVPEYTLRYRQKNVEGAEWFPAKTTSNILTLWNLKPGTTYEYQLSKKCNTVYSDWSLLKEFTTTLEFEEESVLDCGIAPNISVTNKDPLPNMASGSTFKAGDFPVTVMEVSGNNGRFTGKGFVKMPYLENIKVYVEFTNILVNTDQEMAEGSVRTAYDPTWRNILNIADLAQGVGEFVDAVGDLGESVNDILEDVFNTDDEDEENAPPVDSEMEEGETVPPSTETSGENETDTNTSDTSSDAGNEESSSGSSNNYGNGSTPNTGGTTGDNASDTPNPDTNEKDEQEVVIVYNGSEYRNGETITVPYDKNNSYYALTLKNYPDESSFNWQILQQGTDYTSRHVTNEPKYDNLGIDMKKTYILDVVANYGKQQIKVTLRRELQDFSLVDMYAKPEDSPKRIAKSGEKLYLVKKSLTKANRKVDFSVKIDPKLSQGDISSEDITWYYEKPNTQYNLGKNYGKKHIHLNLEEQEANYQVNVKAGKPDVIEKGIEVVWVEGDKEQYNFVPTGVYNNIVSKYGSLEQLFGIFDDYNIGNIPVAIEQIKVGGSKANTEIPNSRKYKYVEKGYINGGLSVYFDKFFSPPQLVLLERTGVAKIGLTLEFNAGIKLEGGVEKIKIIENDYFENNDPYIKFNPYGCAKLKLGAELLVAKNLLQIDIGGDVSSCIGGNIQYKFATEKWEGKLYFDPLILSGWVKIKSKGLLDFELIDWKDSFKVTDRKSVDFLD